MSVCLVQGWFGDWVEDCLPFDEVYFYSNSCLYGLGLLLSGTTLLALGSI